MGPGWAYPVRDKVQPPRGDPNTPVKVAGSSKTYTEAQVDDLMSPPDWFPEEHPTMPSIVAKGQGDVRACDSCHLPNGMGHPESATLAGFSATYILRQMADMKSGDRKTGGIMDVIAKAISDEDARQAAAYFASLQPFPYIKVVEATTVPKSYVLLGGMRLPLPAGGRGTAGAAHHSSAGRSRSESWLAIYTARGPLLTCRQEALRKERNWSRLERRAKPFPARSAMGNRSKGSG